MLLSSRRPGLNKATSRKKLCTYAFLLLFFWTYAPSRATRKLLQTDILNSETYRDCDGTSIDELRRVFFRDGIVLFTPCSLRSKQNTVNSVRAHVLESCPGQQEEGFEGTGCNNRIVQSNHTSVLDLAIDHEILHVLSLLHQRRPFPFQTLNFKFGTGQPMHSDLIHFAGWPSLTMTAAWVALEDVTEQSGPLEYYLGSQKDQFQTMDMLSCPLGAYSTCYEHALNSYIEENSFKWRRAHMLPRKGQVVIWDSNTIHGGGFVADKTATRTSQVTHYFFDDDKFFFQPKLSVGSGEQFHSFSMRIDVKAGMPASEVIRKHWNHKSPEYLGHYQRYYSTNLHDEALNDLEVASADLTQ